MTALIVSQFDAMSEGGTGMMRRKGDPCVLSYLM
jgi:hypothetical protein